MVFSGIILNTKLYIPPVSPSLVARPGVLEKLDQALDHAITLVSAPAGFGKTTLLSEWSESKPGKLKPLAWLSLDPEDNDVTRFILYLAASLDSLEKGISDSVLPLLQMNQPPAPTTILTSLINEVIETLPAPFVLALDDFHTITSPAIHELFLFLVDHIPPQMRLVILTREDPPLPLARLRAQQKLTEIRAADLRFSLKESTTFLNQVMGLDLSPVEIEALETRIEGWIAGLQMAAISMHARDDRASFIRTFASSHRFIFDYLIEEVLGGLSPESQDFLLKTSILDRMCAPLCDAVLGKNNSQNILLHLEKTNLFIIPLDDQRRWYRYHHLFADLLRQQLRAAHSDKIQVLHQNACTWYRDNDIIGDAIHHALVLEDFDTVADLSERLVFESVEHQELFIIANWLENLPPKIKQNKPWLSVAFAWMLFRTRQFDRVKLHLQDIEHSLLETQQQDAHIQSHIAAVKAYLAGVHGDIERAASMARKSLNLLPEKEMRLRGSMFSLLGTSFQRMGNFEEAKKAYSDGIVASKAAGDWQSTIEGYGDLAGFYVERGLLRDAFSTCQEALKYVESSFRMGGRNPVATAYIHFRMSTIFRHWNELEVSLRHAKRSIEIMQKWGSSFRLGYANLAIALQAVGRHQEAMQAIQQAEAIASQESRFWVADVRSLKVLLWLDQGNLDAASRWAGESGLTADDEIRFPLQRQYQILSQVLLAQGQQGNAEALDKALQLLTRLQTVFDSSNAGAYVLQVLIFKALAYHAQGKMEEALSAMDRALSAGEPGGYIRVFVRHGIVMKELLEQTANQGIFPEYSRKLLAALGDGLPEDELEGTPLEVIIEPLTRRELEVLRLLDSELPIPEIAAELVLSVDTVRTHIKHIYRKLDVHSRFEAVVRGKKLRLI